MKKLGYLKICGQTIEVLEGDENDCPHLQSARGVYIPGKAQIWLEEDQPADRLVDTLVHESLHGLVDMSGIFDATASILGLERDDPRMAKWEEAFIRVITPHVAALFGAPKLSKKP